MNMKYIKEKYPLTIVQRGPYTAYIIYQGQNKHFILETYKNKGVGFDLDPADAEMADVERNHRTTNDNLKTIVSSFIEKTEMILKAKEEEGRGE